MANTSLLGLEGLDRVGQRPVGEIADVVGVASGVLFVIRVGAADRGAAEREVVGGPGGAGKGDLQAAKEMRVFLNRLEKLPNAAS
jgi:hypothetical protein